MSARRRGTLLLLVLIVAAVVIATVVLAGGPSGEDPTETSAFDPSVPTSTHTPPPAGPAAPTDDPTNGADPTDPSTGTASPSPPSLTAKEQAEISAETSNVLGTALKQTAEIDPGAPSDIVKELSDVASRSYLSELESERLEFEAEGWTREGFYALGDFEVLEHSSTSDGEVATVRVCVDSSALITRRADGEAIETSPSSDRAWNIFVLERIGSADWRISGRTFPHDPAC